MMIMDGSAGIGLIVHEAGHQYTMGQLANNEWREGWLDEGFTSFQTGWFFESHGGPPAYDGLEPEVLWLDLERWSEPVSFPGERYRDFTTYNAMVYSKAQLFYEELRYVVGDETMRRILRAYFARWRLKHVDEDALREVAEDVSGRDLKWLFAQWLHATPLFDYRLKRVERHHLADGRWRTVVTIERRGGGRLPGDVAPGPSGWTTPCGTPPGATGWCAPGCPSRGRTASAASRSGCASAPTISVATTGACSSPRSPPAPAPRTASSSTAAGAIPSGIRSRAPRRACPRGRRRDGPAPRSRRIAHCAGIWTSAPTRTSGSTPCGWRPPSWATSIGGYGTTPAASRRVRGGRSPRATVRRCCAPAWWRGAAWCTRTRGRGSFRPAATTSRASVASPGRRACGPRSGGGRRWGCGCSPAPTPGPRSRCGNAAFPSRGRIRTRRSPTRCCAAGAPCSCGPTSTTMRQGTPICGRSGATLGGAGR